MNIVYFGLGHWDGLSGLSVSDRAFGGSRERMGINERSEFVWGIKIVGLILWTIMGNPGVGSRMGDQSWCWTSDVSWERGRAIYDCRFSFSGHDGGSKEERKREEWKRLCLYTDWVGD
jgi:hypothetical protein